MLDKLNLGIANVYIVKGDRKTVVIDTGQAGKAETIVARLKALGVTPSEVSLILLTHAHIDHAGSAAALQKLTSAPLAVHAADSEMLQRGHNGVMQPLGFEARLLYKFISVPFPKSKADLFVDEQTDLSAYGIRGRILHTPGHTAGSISILLDSGEAMIGDLLRGGALGGALLPGIPRYPYYLYDVQDKAQVRASVRKVLDAGAQRFYVGHGGPMSRAAVESWLARVEAQAG